MRENIRGERKLFDFKILYYFQCRFAIYSCMHLNYSWALICKLQRYLIVNIMNSVIRFKEGEVSTLPQNLPPRVRKVFVLCLL